MYEDNDNLYLVSDMDEDIKKRKELIEEAKNINADKNWNEIYRQISDLRRNQGDESQVGNQLMKIL